MIATVTPNPALDLFLEAPRLEFDAVLRASRERRAAGGKGINVTRVLRQLGTESSAWILGGGGSARELGELAAAEGIALQSVDTGRPVRINVHLAESGGRHLKVNMAGDAVDPAVTAALQASLAAATPEVLVLAGSLPPGLPVDFHAGMIAWARNLGIATALDASGPPLAAAAAAHPTILKVNHREIRDVADVDAADDAALAVCLAGMLAGGTQIACVTRSEGGAVLADASGTWVGGAPDRSPRRAVGAGDAFLAGLLDARARGLSGAQLLAFALATGTAWALAEDGAANRARVEDLARRCAFRQLA